MEYKVCKIETLQEIEKAQRLEINNFNWNCVYKPVAYGYMAYLKVSDLLFGCGGRRKSPENIHETSGSGIP